MGSAGGPNMGEGYSSFSDSCSKSHGSGWNLSGSVSAGLTNASAYMGTSIENPTAFNGAYGIRVADYSGVANGEAYREEITIEQHVPCSSVWCPVASILYRHNHKQQVLYPEERNYGNGTYLQSWVLMVLEESMKVYGEAKSNPKIKLDINVSLGDSRLTTRVEWESGGRTYITTHSTTITKVIPQAQPSSSVSANVSGRVEASKSASISYMVFEGTGYDSADASYATHGE